jgi:hypothetical protein
MSRQSAITVRVRSSGPGPWRRPALSGKRPFTRPAPQPVGSIRKSPIELIDGSNLLYLLAEHAGIEAKIVPPEDWKDPVADAPEPHT